MRANVGQKSQLTNKSFTQTNKKLKHKKSSKNKSYHIQSGTDAATSTRDGITGP